VPEPAPAPLPPAKPEAEQDLQGTAAAEPQLMLGFRAGADFLLASDVRPKVGYSFSPFFQYEYARLADRLGLGLRAEFTFDRFQEEVTPQVYIGTGTFRPYVNTRTLSFFDFALLATATLHFHPLQPWVAAGTGLGLAYFLTPEAALAPGESRTTRPLVLGAGGLDLAVGRGVLIGLHVEYRNMLAKPGFLLASGNSIQVFGDRLSAAAALLYQF
jgi:hypothetical protein